MRAFEKHSVIKFLSICSLIFVTACAHAPAEPVVDMRGKSPLQYQADLAECRGYADKIDAGGNTVGGAAVGAVAGAAIGALLGAIVHAPAAGAALGAGAGGVGGASGGLTASMLRKQMIMDRCLDARGYLVLG